MSIRVVVADDHPIVRNGMRYVIENSGQDIEIVAEAGDGIQALEVAEKHRADVYVLDITLPELNGFEVAARILKQFPEARIIMLSFHDSAAMVEKAMESGALGYVLKESATDDIVNAITAVAGGRFYLSPAISGSLVKGFLDRKKGMAPAPEGKPLSEREREILKLIAEGLTSKEIATRLDLSANTVHVHRNNLMAKLELHKETDLVRYAIREGIVEA